MSHNTARFATSRTPFYTSVPKDLEANLRFRKEMYRMGASSKADARGLWEMCAKDILFYTNVFGWTFSPKERADCPVIPFITWEFQDDALLQIEAAIGKHDVLIKKSRNMGATWMCLLVLEWRWHFHNMQNFLMASRKEDLVDKTGDPNCLFAKIDFLHQYQPKFIRPTVERNRLMIYNHDTKSVITGESTNGDLGRGGRAGAILLDEFAAVENGTEVNAATSETTNCRIFLSTPKGVGNEFYNVYNIMQAKTPERIVSMHWTLHPEHSKGLYHDAEGKPRSPWYDNKFNSMSPRMIAQELDIDFMGSDFEFFDAEMLQAHEKQYCRAPVMQGDIEYDGETLEPTTGFVNRRAGPLALWAAVDALGRMPKGREFVVAADTSAGTGSSNSTLSIGDRLTGEKIGEYVNPNIRPEAFAAHAVALCKWLNNAFLIWETNGPGRTFGDKVLELGYRNIYWRRQEASLSRKQSDIPGWNPTKDNKNSLLSDYYSALKTGRFINRSYEALRECRCYIHYGNGNIEHVQAVKTDDPSGARANHGDRVIADALCVKGLKGYKIPDEPIQETPLTSLANRRLIRQKATPEQDW